MFPIVEERREGQPHDADTMQVVEQDQVAESVEVAEPGGEGRVDLDMAGGSDERGRLDRRSGRFAERRVDDADRAVTDGVPGSRRVSHQWRASPRST
jgi:hypothetical protein